MPPRWRVDLENLEHLAAQIGERVFHASRNIDDVVLADEVGPVLDRQRPFPALHDIDVVGLRVVMELAARTARDEPVEMNVDLLGPEARIDQLDLLARPRLHRAGRRLIQMPDLEHALVPTPASPAEARKADSVDPSGTP